MWDHKASFSLLHYEGGGVCISWAISTLSSPFALPDTHANLSQHADRQNGLENEEQAAKGTFVAYNQVEPRPPSLWAVHLRLLPGEGPTLVFLKPLHVHWVAPVQQAILLRTNKILVRDLRCSLQ